MRVDPIARVAHKECGASVGKSRAAVLRRRERRRSSSANDDEVADSTRDCTSTAQKEG